MKKKVKFTTNLDEKLLKKIKIRAVEKGKNVNEILEELIESHELQENKKGEWE